VNIFNGIKGRSSTASAAVERGLDLGGKKRLYFEKVHWLGCGYLTAFFNSFRPIRRCAMFKWILGSFSVFLILMVCFGASDAAELIVATPYEPSIDPDFMYTSPNAAYARTVFGNLVERNKDAIIDPDLGLATSWKLLDDKTWEFKLRKGVKFHDGSEFTAEDVVFSIHRKDKIPNNPASYVMNVREIADVIIKDPYTIIIKTTAPHPLLTRRLMGVHIVSKRLVQNATTEDFTSGKVAIGTGPYKFVKYIPGDRYVIERNEYYWGEKPAFEKVTFKIMPDDSSRVAALLSGDVDIVENLTPTMVEDVAKKKWFHVSKRPSSRALFLEIDSSRDQSPYVTDKKGQPMEKNPLKDVRVRKALSMAINRDAIVSKIMLGLAEKANQLIPKGFYSYNPEIKDMPYNPKRAKQLLTEAGYPDGFGLTIHGPNDRYVFDEKIVQAIGQMFERIGIKTKIETMPKNVYFGPLNSRKFSMGLIGWDNAFTGSSMLCINASFHTINKERGHGTWNAGGYSNPEFDRIIEEAEITLDKNKHEDLLKKAMKIVIDDQAAIPLHTQFTIFGIRNGIEYTPQVDELFYAPLARPKK
jgi:peptide/nickel transport system substrate-binding protein